MAKGFDYVGPGALVLQEILGFPTFGLWKTDADGKKHV